MKRIFKIFLFVGNITLIFHDYAVAQSSTKLPSYEIPNSAILTLISGVNGQSYDLYVHLPSSYWQDTAKIYPVVYLLDGQWDFPIVSGIYGSQYYDGFLPELIIVGITWSGKDQDLNALRERDLTPTAVQGKPQSGGARKFLQCIGNEIIPFISARYRVAADRTLMGSSLGGLFTLYALFTQPSLFQRYVVTSPTLSWDSSVLHSLEKTYEAASPLPSCKLYMGKGELEDDLPEFQQYVSHLRSAKPGQLQLQTQIQANTGHSATVINGFSRGLQFVFKRPSLRLTQTQLTRYTGTYQLENINVSFSIKDGNLLAVTPETKYILLAASDKDFYVNGTFITVHFKQDEKGKVLGFQLDQFDSSVFLKKVN
jgi:hypothetical protein